MAREPGQGRYEPGYQNTTNIYDLQVAQTVYEQAMETPITVMQRELLSLAPEMWTQVANAINQRHVPQEQVVQAMVEKAKNEDEQGLADQTHLAPKLQATIEEDEDENDPS